jgi:capsular polysaccharide export protein
VQTDRRQRTLSLQELVTGAMLLYPTYIDPKIKQVVDAMQALKILDEQRKVKQQSISSNWFNRKGNQLKALWQALK